MKRAIIRAYFTPSNSKNSRDNHPTQGKEEIQPLEQVIGARTNRKKIESNHKRNFKWTEKFYSPPLFVVCGSRDMPKPPNILLLVVDTLRADHLGCYGYSRDPSPNIDRWLAAEGVLFEHHSAAASYTHPFFTTTLTGRFLLDHGVVVQGTSVPPREGIPSG